MWYTHTHQRKLLRNWMQRKNKGCTDFEFIPKMNRLDGRASRTSKFKAVNWFVCSESFSRNTQTTRCMCFGLESYTKWFTTHNKYACDPKKSTLNVEAEARGMNFLLELKIQLRFSFRFRFFSWLQVSQDICHHELTFSSSRSPLKTRVDSFLTLII